MSKVGEHYRERQEMGLEHDGSEDESNYKTKKINYQTHNDVIIKTTGTSFRGDIRLDYYDILSRLGKPRDGDEYKIDVAWEIEFDDGTVATLYNWKNGRNYCGEDGLKPCQIDEWNIGGFKSDAVEKVYELFKKEDKCS